MINKGTKFIFHCLKLNRMKVAIIIPTFNERGNIIPLYKKIKNKKIIRFCS